MISALARVGVRLLVHVHRPSARAAKEEHFCGAAAFFLPGEAREPTPSLNGQVHDRSSCGSQPLHQRKIRWWYGAQPKIEVLFKPTVVPESSALFLLSRFPWHVGHSGFDQAGFLAKCGELGLMQGASCVSANLLCQRL